MATSETNPQLRRYREAYLRMAQDANYRPQVPSDGLGNIQLTLKQINEPSDLNTKRQPIP
jgi:hypothetical protein